MPMDSEVDDDDGIFTQVAETEFKKRKFNQSEPPTSIDVSNLTLKPLVSTVNSQNRFAILADLDIQNDNASVKDAERKKHGKSTSNEKPSRPSFCPPIFLYNVNIKHLVDQLEARSPKIIFKIKNVNRVKSKLYLADVAAHEEMMMLLKEKKVNSYSFTPKELRKTSIIIRGLYAGTEICDIEDAMKGLVPNTVAKVSKFTTTFSNKNNIDTGLFLISLFPGKGLSDVSHIRYLLSQSIVWEKPKKKDQEIQCRRCQRWGHIARNCNREFKCVKCDKIHEPGCCDRKKEEEKSSQPCCVNCGENGHPANWRGCSAYRKYVADKRKRMSEEREMKQTALNNVSKAIRSSKVTHGTSYASVLQNCQNVPTYLNSKSPIIEEFMKLSSYFMEPEELSLEREAEKFINNYRHMSKIAAKTEFLRILNKVKSSYVP